MRVFRSVAWMAAAALGVAACNTSDPPDPTIPALMVLVDGTPQAGEAGTVAGNALRVEIKNAAGDPVQGVSVDWAIATGGGTLSAPSTTTSTAGIAAVTYTYAAVQGVSTVTASVSGLNGSPQTFSLTATPPPAPPGGNN